MADCFCPRTAIQKHSVIHCCDRGGAERPQRIDSRSRLTEVLRPYPLTRIEAAFAELVRQANLRDTKSQKRTTFVTDYAISAYNP